MDEERFDTVTVSLEDIDPLCPRAAGPRRGPVMG